MKTTDILSRIEERDSAIVVRKAKTLRMWAIHHNVGGLATIKLYSYTKARKLVARANRLGLSVYIAGPDYGYALREKRKGMSIPLALSGQRG